LAKVPVPSGLDALRAGSGLGLTARRDHDFFSSDYYFRRSDAI
jgi:hypothetical protein